MSTSAAKIVACVSQATSGRNWGTRSEDAVNAPAGDAFQALHPLSTEKGAPPHLDVHTVEDAHGRDVLRRVGGLARGKVDDRGLVVGGGLPHRARRGGTPSPGGCTQPHGRGTAQAASPPALVAPHLLGGTLTLHLHGRGQPLESASSQSS